MNHLFQVTIYTGQQLILEALQRWLRRPCDTEPDAQRQRRTSIKSLIVLLLKTAATGVLATILDAAIEYRRRQLLAAAEESPEDLADAAAGSSSSLSSSSSRFGFGPLTRAGIASWKSRLVLAIDEMERHAEQFGIEPTHRFTPAKPDPSLAGGSTQQIALAEEKAAQLSTVTAAAIDDEDSELRRAALSTTIDQLRELIKLNDDHAERALDEKVDSLLDSLLGGAESDSLPQASGASTPSAGAKLVGSSSSDNITAAAAAAATVAITNNITKQEEHKRTSSISSSECSTASVCSICMDRCIRVNILGCHHELCFQCARRLCDTPDHSLPQCPFCRQTITGFSAAATTLCSGGAALVVATVPVDAAVE